MQTQILCIIFLNIQYCLADRGKAPPSLPAGVEQFVEKAVYAAFKSQKRILRLQFYDKAAQNFKVIGQQQFPGSQKNPREYISHGFHHVLRIRHLPDDFRKNPAQIVRDFLLLFLRYGLDDRRKIPTLQPGHILPPFHAVRRFPYFFKRRIKEKTAKPKNIQIALPKLFQTAVSFPHNKGYRNPIFLFCLPRLSGKNMHNFLGPIRRNPPIPVFNIGKRADKYRCFPKSGLNFIQNIFRNFPLLLLGGRAVRIIHRHHKKPPLLIRGKKIRKIGLLLLIQILMNPLHQYIAVVNIPRILPCAIRSLLPAPLFLDFGEYFSHDFPNGIQGNRF